MTEKYEYIVDLCGDNPPESDDNGIEIEAVDYSYAAEEGAKNYDDHGDKDIVSEGAATVYVRKVGEKEWKTFVVFAEIDITYLANEKINK
jgi:hypothetical protein